MNKIALRADGSNKIGMGHIMRCTTIAKEFLKLNIDVFFITKSNEITNSILQKSHLKIINLDDSSLEEEIRLVKNILLENDIDSIIVDSYNLNDNYLKELTKICKLLISIDDNNLYRNPSDIIINPNIYGEEIKYYKKNSNVKLLLGCKYIILRDEFVTLPPIIIKDKVENILITMGGTDVNNYTVEVLKSIEDINLNINVIIGTGFNNIEEIKNKSKNNEKINLIYNPINMAKIMKINDLAISAAGTTINELASMGVPTILINQAKNQERASKKFDELKMMNCLGSHGDVKLYDIKVNILKLIEDKSRREEMNCKCIEVINKNGVNNIVDEVIKYYNNK